MINVLYVQLLLQEFLWHKDNPKIIIASNFALILFAGMAFHYTTACSLLPLLPHRQESKVLFVRSSAVTIL